MSELEKQRKKLELDRVKLARAEMEFKILERLEDIKRLEKEIETQKKREDELNKQIQGA